ncbi:cadmium-translocating P-type ATPase [Paenibacillus sp. MWE-103]|uniref:Cd(2+)-exporting ATPase n=1 Tax=Paenibacillus artemisiicola TaxID=1172618 RepID=A0ABS3W491_9BACL|nr:cation-translocating P-type ATPase [Paenibacillus artemisiicola]MBO7743128.1 cadmium-translocating P-type ATPase [Paenibacillus artemisiicola]
MSDEQESHALERIEPSRAMRTYTIEGMDCSSCALTIENHLKMNTAVKQVSVHFTSGKMTIEHDNSVEEVIQAVAQAGYKAVPAGSVGRSREATKNRSENNAVVIAGVLLVCGFLGSHAGVQSMLVNALYGIAIVIGGYKPARSAYYAARSRSLDMNVLMTAAVIGAAAIGEWLEGATVVWLFALGNMLQARSIEKTRDSIRNLIDLAPAEADIRSGSQLLRKPVEEIRIGEMMVVKPGNKIPLDGTVVAGQSSVNQAPITGESIPVDKLPGDPVYAGTINEEGLLEIQATKLAQDTTLAKIVHLVEEAQEKKAPTEAIVDKFARVYTPIVFLLALAVMIFPPIIGFGAWSAWFYKGLELLVVACPCALVISTPVAIVAAIGNAARNGVLIKGGAFLELAGKVSAIAFDKTGTLTEGKPMVSQVIPSEGSDAELLAIAYGLEEYSTHPIAKSVVQYAKERGIAPARGEQFRNLPGKGVGAIIHGQLYYAGSMTLFQELRASLGGLGEQIRALQQEGNTIVIVGTVDRMLGVIAVADRIRAASVAAISGLRREGIREVIMLTGDNEGTAKKIAALTGVTRSGSELLPENKASVIRQLQEEGHTVAMVGDGINDAPALATADVGIAMGGAGTDTAIETADIVLMADNLEKLPHTMRLSRTAMRIIKQNIAFSLMIKAAALILIFPEILTLWIAVISDTGAALVVILNSMRLLKIKN